MAEGAEKSHCPQVTDPPEGFRKYQAMQVLLVEDDAAIAEMYRAQLTADGFDVTIAEDGERALELVRGSLPELVLLDMELPRLDGIGVLQDLSGNPVSRDVPVVVVSNTPGATRMEEAYTLGIRAWLVKSATTPTQLSGIVEVMLRKKA
jgi:two-component system chemotaxis response regulator CheY